MKELASDGDPAAGTIISRWLVLPPVKCVMPQEAIKNFVTAHILLGRLGCSLPLRSDDVSAAAQALVACRQLLYWLNRQDMPMEKRRAECGAALAVLGRHDLGVSINIMRELSHSYFEEGLARLPGAKKITTSIREIFPEAIAEICWYSLKRPEQKHGYFDYFQLGETLEFAVGTLRECGNIGDIPMLRLWTAETYAHRLGADRGGSLTVLDALPDVDSTDALVRTEIKRPYGMTIETNLRVHGSGDQMKIVDVTMGGVSMVVMQRDEFAAVIRRRGLDGLISDLKRRTGDLTLATARH